MSGTLNDRFCLVIIGVSGNSFLLVILTGFLFKLIGTSATRICVRCSAEIVFVRAPDRPENIAEPELPKAGRLTFANNKLTLLA